MSANHHHPYSAIIPTQSTLLSPHAVLILGASRGIGAGVAYIYASAGASTILLPSRRTTSLEDVATRCRSLASHPVAKFVVIERDIASSTSVTALASRVTTDFGGRLDALIVNADYSYDLHLNITNSPPVELQRRIDVNHVGTYYAMHYLIPLLLATSDSAKALVAFSSLVAPLVGGLIANPQYCFSKMAQTRLVEIVALQFVEQGLLAVTVHPGAVMMEMASQRTGDEEFTQKNATDSSDLCGAFCAWLTEDAASRRWLSGRLVSTTWDVGELEKKRQEIEEKDLFKAKYAA